MFETALDFGNDNVDNIFAQELQTIPLTCTFNDFGAILLPLVGGTLVEHWWRWRAGGALVEGKAARCMIAEVFDPHTSLGGRKF